MAVSTLYLIDGHNAVLANSEINDTIPLETGETQLINGSFAIRVPFVAFFPGFTYIDYDDGLDATGWDATLTQGARLGSRMTTSFAAGGGSTSTLITLTGSAPTTVIVVWEVYEVTRPASSDDPKDGVFTRLYTEGDAVDFVCEVTFDNGVSWNTVVDGVLFAIPLADQGTQFKIRFTNSTGDRKWIGSWAVLY